MRESVISSRIDSTRIEALYALWMQWTLAVRSTICVADMLVGIHTIATYPHFGEETTIVISCKSAVIRSLFKREHAAEGWCLMLLDLFCKCTLTVTRRTWTEV